MEKLAKVVLLGDTNVGKTAIAQRLCTDSFFDVNVSATVASSSFIINRKIDDKVIKFNLLDTAGQERYKSITPIYFQNADIILLVYDSNSNETLSNLDSWYQMVIEKGPKHVKFIVIGNKVDLLESSNPLTDEVVSFATKIEAEISIVSAKTGEGMNTLLTTIGSKIEDLAQTNGETVELNAENNKSKGCYC